MTDRVDRAMAAHPRAAYLPAAERRRARLDHPLPLGHGATSSQPSTVATMLRLLDVPAGARVLDVGAGSGWTTVLLAELTGPTGDVVGVEIEPELAAWGAANVAAAGLARARLVPAVPGVLGLPDAAPFDRILVSAEAPVMAPELLDQLGEGGVIVAPVAHGLEITRRRGAGLTTRRIEGYRFVPLR